MKLRIFNTKLFLLCGLLLAAQGGFAQQKTTDDKEFNKQMLDLQKQMADLQKQMRKLKTDKIKQKSDELRKLSKELSVEALARVDDINVSPFISGQGSFSFSSPSAITLSGVGAKALRSPELLKAPHAITLNWSGDEKKLEEMLQSGEVKEKVKNYSKSYSVNGDDKLSINNRYGKVTVNTWGKNEIKVDVQMKAYANEDEDAQKLLDKITIADSKENSLVSFKTTIEPTNTRSNGTFVIGTWFSGGKKQVTKLEVNYVVYMPAKSQLDVTNVYGNVILPDLTGKVNVKLTYGALVSQQLNNPSIHLVNGDAKIDAMTNGDVSITYGNLNLGTADKVKAKVTYGGLNVEKLKSYGELAAVYGDGIKIVELDKSCKNLNVKAVYTTVNLGVKDDYDFDVTTTSGSFNYDKSAVKVISTTPAESTRYYTPTRTFKGQVNKGSSDKVITVKSTYSTVKFDN